MGAGDLLGWILLLVLLALVVGIGAWQWRAYTTLDQRISHGDDTLLHSASTRVEQVVDAPQGSVIVPYVPDQLMPTKDDSRQL